jgi:small subunit ribosomal protein S4e
MDVVRLPTLNRNYRVLLDHRGRLVLLEIDQAETSSKLCKIMRKDIVRGRRTQLSFHDGKTLVGDFDEFRPGDGVKLALPELKVLERFPFEKGATALVTGGKNVSKVGTITDIKLVEGSQPNIVTLEAIGETFQAPEHYVFIVGKGKPAISLLGATA